MGVIRVGEAMRKHIIDHPHKGENDRTKPYLDIERKTGGPGEREKALNRGVSSGKDQGERAREFVRIERESREE